MRTDQQPQTTSIRVTAAHEHGWCTESGHRTLEGVIRYVRCVGCGARRVDLDAGPGVVPTAMSRVLGGAEVDDLGRRASVGPASRNNAGGTNETRPGPA